MTSDPIALIGAACRFPGAADLVEFAELLAEGRDAVGEVPPERWARALFYHPERGQPGKAYTYAAGTIPGVDQFDPMFFGISPREAVQMDPQQRLLLELTHEAIEDAGLDGSKLAGRKIGVYIGGSSSDYMTMRLGDPSGADAYFMTGSTLCSLANRISYVFDLRGPSFTVDTACSSSLVALHLACEALRGGETAAAVVGGVNLLLAPQSYVGFARASMLSPRGRCHAFDARADGYVRAEGGGVVLLKRLSDALADGDMVRAVISATGVNSDGRTTGFSLPNKAAQIDLLTEVYARCDVTPDDLVYLEAHGTGTPAGDPIEATAIGTVLGQRRRLPLPIGSVKTNLGHLEPASGMAGLLKVMLALEQGVIPRSLHCETPNPAIAFEELNLRLVPERVKLSRGKRPAAAAVNSFGFGGTNAHAVVTAAPKPEPVAPAPATELPPFLLSARAEGALRALATTWRQSLAKTPVDRLVPALRGLARGREQHPIRLVVAGQNRADLLAGLDAYLEDRPHPALASGSAALPGPLVFVFSGNGSQWAGMGTEAIRLNPSFARGIDAVDAELAPLLGWSLRAHLTGAVDEAALRRTEIAQPLLFGVQVASVLALREVGIVATAQLGHSAGEVAAAWAAGALSLAQAARVIAARSHRQQATHGLGRMAVLGLSQEAARKIIQGIPGVDLAAINSSASVTVAGSEEGIAQVGTRAAGLLFTPLDLDYAFHSAVMDPIEPDLLADLADLEPAEPDASFVSTVTGQRIEGRALTAAYWWRNVRAPVRFAEGLRALIDDGARVFLEIGPQPVLQSYLLDAFRNAGVSGRALSTLSRRHAGRDPFAMVAARCHVAGVSLSASACFDGPAMRRNLPSYPWQRERYWIERTIESTDVTQAPLDHPLLGYRRGAEPNDWFNHLSVATEAWLADHVVDRSVVLPAAAIIDLAWAAARARHPQAPVLELRDLEVARPLVLDCVRELAFKVSDAGAFQLSSRPRLGEEPWTIHATGHLSAGESIGALLKPVTQTPESLTHTHETLTAAGLYTLAGRLGLEYGPAFRTVFGIEGAGENEALVTLRRSLGEMRQPERHRSLYLLDPALLDGALQGLVALAAKHLSRAWSGKQMGVLPWRFGRARLLRTTGALVASAQLRITRVGPRSVCADIAVLDSNGTVIAELSEAWFVAVPLARVNDVADRVFRIDHVAASNAGILPAGLLATALFNIGDAQDGDPSEKLLLAEAYATERAFAALSAVAGTGRAFSIAELVAAGALHPNSVPLAEGLLDWLETDGLAEPQLGMWVLADSVDLPPAEELWRSLLFDAPASVAETALLGLTGEALAERLRSGEKLPLPVPLLEQMWTASPSGWAALAALGDAIRAIAAHWPPHRPLRILELGARKGAGTEWLLQCLAQQSELHYLATTVSPDDLPSLAERTAVHPGARARLWQPGHAEKLPERDFDLIVGLFPLSTLDPTDLLAIHDGLASSGLLICAEPEPNRLWGLIAGADPHWWVREGGRMAMPLRQAADWCTALRETGFVETLHRRISSPIWPLALIAAQRDDLAQVQRVAGPLTPVRLFSQGMDELAEGLEVALLEAERPVERCDLAAFPGDNEAGIEYVMLLPAPEGDAETAELVPSLLSRIARSSAVLSDEPPQRLWLIVRAESSAAPFAAALSGLRRVLANEAPEVDCRLLRISPRLDDAAAIKHACSEILAPDAEAEITWAPEGREVGRIRRGLNKPKATPGAAARLHVTRPGLLDTLAWQQAAEPVVLADGQVGIAVAAAGLNFRDVMWAMGLLPDEALLYGFAGPTLGLECAGLVTSVAPDVTDLAVGDRVMAFAPASLGTHVVTARHAVVRMPATMSFAEAATIPVAFLTVVYALGTLAQLAQGERVLIHGGAGGVGLAAIQYARQRGAVVFATAGSPAKRTLLRLLGVDHVLDSRSLGFADEIMRLTDNEGVDVVLNSLSGEAMECSLGLLRPFGRFLELGKRDFYRNTAVGLRPLRHNISYFAIDADQLPVRRPALARALFAEIEGLFAADALRPLPYRSFRFDEAADAFRLMQNAGHIGKIVLQPGAHGLSANATRPDFTVRADRTYLLTGALSGFGLATAHWLVRHGARHLALLGRRGAATPGIAAALAAWEQEDVSAHAFACDVADDVELTHVLDSIRVEMPPIGGVVHAAMVLDDGLLPHLSAERFAAVFAAKFTGAALLDQLTRNDPVELFLLFSSVTTALGNPGQANYVAANAALEAIAERRHAEGLPALAVAWGPIGDAGYLARQSDVSEALLRRLGTAHLRASEALDALPALLEDGHPVLGFADLRWGAARQQLPLLNATLFRELVDARVSEATDIDLRARLAGCSQEGAREIVVGLLVEEVATILKLPAERIDPARPLAELGMDSLMAVELRLSLEQRVGVSVPLLSLSDGATLSTMAARIVRSLIEPDEAENVVSLLARFEPQEEAPAFPQPVARTAL